MVIQNRNGLESAIANIERQYHSGFSQKVEAAVASRKERTLDRGLNNKNVAETFLFNDNYPYTSEIYARLPGESAFKKLENWMLAQGYRRFVIYNTTAIDCNLTLSIANPRWSEEPPRGGFEYKIKHTGISAQFDYYVKDPPVFGLCIPNGMSPIWKPLIQWTKKCGMCKPCRVLRNYS